MESSGPSRNSSHIPEQGWANILGTVIAVLTLTIPLVATSYYSKGVEGNNQYQTTIQDLTKND